MSATQDKFLKLARERFKLAEDADSKQRERELEDLRFYAGQQWDDDLLKSRQGQTIGTGSGTQTVPARPSLTINKTREPVRQVLNAERQADLAIELIPADDWGNDTGPINHDEIELREGLVRRIQRDSEAADARTWAFARSSIAGRGYWLVMTRYVPGKSVDQEVYIERIYNQAAVLLDPTHEQPDGSDAEWGFYGTDMSWDVYKSQFPNRAEKRNRVSTADGDTEWRALGDEAPGWFSKEVEEGKRSVRVMNYYYTEHESKTLYHLSNGRACYADELPAMQAQGLTVATDEDGTEQTHTQQIKKIRWAKIDGCQVLEETDWPGHWLPIIKTVGEELQPYDAERRCEGIVRPMRDPCKGNNYIVSKFVERVGLTPIPPIMMAGGQDEGFEAEYDAMNTRTLSRVHYNQVDQFERPAPQPFRLDARAEIADIAMGVQVFGQAIQSTSVTPDTALGQTQDQVKSGRLAKLLIDQATLGTSNFLDNLVRSMRHEARVVNDLLYPIYGRPGRLARMVNPQGQMSSVIIGQPFNTQGEGKQARPVPVPDYEDGQPVPEGAKLFKLTPDADFNVATKISKKTETRRQEIAESLLGVVGASPEQMGVMGDLVWRYIDMPEHEELEKRYRATLIPAVQAVIAGGNAPIPPDVQQKMAMLEQALQEATALADKNKADLAKTQMQSDADLKKTQIQEDAETQRMALKESREDARTAADNETKLAVAELGAKVERLALFLEERARLGVEHNQALQADADRQHEAQLSSQEHAQSLEQSDVQQQQALEAQQLGHQQALEQQVAATPPEGQ